MDENIPAVTNEAIACLVADLTGAGLYVVVWTDGDRHHLMASSDARWLDLQRFNVKAVPLIHSWYPAQTAK